jgi:hypothetical protein
MLGLFHPDEEYVGHSILTVGALSTFRGPTGFVVKFFFGMFLSPIPLMLYFQCDLDFRIVLR